MCFRRLVLAALCLFGLSVVGGGLHAIHDLNRVAASGGQVDQLAPLTRGFLWLSDAWMTWRDGAPGRGHSPADLAQTFTYVTSIALAAGVLTALAGVAAWRAGTSE